jgi:glutamate synthase (NADPH/NADH)
MGLVVGEIHGQEKVKAESQEEYTPYHPQRGYGWAEALPARQGLYDPQLEKDACGVGFAALVSPHSYNLSPLTCCCSHIKGKASHKIVSDGKLAAPIPGPTNYGG